MQVLSRQRGVSLIEVLMAVLIFSIGLIGMAGLLVMATRSNQAAYLRTQVTFLAGSLADRMRANPVGVWSNSYNSNAYASISGTTTCDSSSPCDPGQVAQRDQQIWVSQLKTFLPNPQATVQCSAASSGFTPNAWSPGLPASGSTAATAAVAGQVGMRPPYGGSCRMTISWTERKAGDKQNREAETQTFAWEFQP